MSETNERLRKAREAAGFPSARAAAKRFHWVESTYSSHENGQTSVPPRAAAKYAKAFKVSPGWILTGEEPLGGVLDAIVKDARPEIKMLAREILELLAKANM